MSGKGKQDSKNGNHIEQNERTAEEVSDIS